MLHVVLYQPEIPPNTGNIMRLCANTGFRLHLIEPLGFDLDEKRLRRAGLDYRDLADVVVWSDWKQYSKSSPAENVYAITTKATRTHSDAQFKPGDHLLFGPETRGLPDALLDRLKSNQKLRVPMLADSRSMNLSNCAAVLMYEAWRQLDYPGSVDRHIQSTD